MTLLAHATAGDIDRQGSADEGVEALILAQTVVKSGVSREIGQAAARRLVARHPHMHLVLLSRAAPRDLVDRLRAAGR